MIREEQTYRRAAVLLAVLVLLGGCGHDEVSFDAEVRPILNQQCLTCHGGVRQAGGFGMLFEAEAKDTTESGKFAIVPGDADASELIRRVTHGDPDERMPPEGPPLAEDDVATLHRWIEQGADWALPWAYIPPAEPPLPEVSNPAWVKNDLDRFVLARLDAERLTPSPQADCAVLIRRVALDLTGLPPTPAQADAFCADPSDAAYAQVVDSLLASPRFGERWAAMWLDLARYADSRGYQKDRHRDIWRYRDWVIDAFNRDLPFDRFTIEQLAGDLLPAPTEAQLIATAFHRNTMTNDEGGTDDEEFRVAAVIDRVNTTFEVWQGTTIACVQCHSHPYDPIRHEEYFQFYAFFNNTADADRGDDAPTLTGFSKSQRVALDRHIAAAPGVLTRPEARDLVRFLDDLDARTTPDELTAPIDARTMPAYDTLRALRLVPTATPVMRELPAAERRPTHVFERGNWLVHGAAVEPEVPSVWPPLPEGAPRDRLGLAQWLVHPDNPLTARVTVNRFWQQLFGTGLVRTLEDFGTQGERPSHPALLDHLALQFMHEHAWSVKALLKEVVTSATYRQASQATPLLHERDPRNRLLARGPRVRLSAEQVRDQALAVSGLLSDKRGGPSVMPPQPEGVWNVIRHVMRWETSPGEDRYRRGLYTYWRRSSPYPSMVAFDAPSREFCVSRRVATNTPLQALVTLNDPVYVEAARALAARMRAAAPDDLTAQLRHGYRLALIRTPTVDELTALAGHYDRMAVHYAAHPAEVAAMEGAETPEDAARIVAANVIMNLDAFVTKE